jgi:ubiquinone biosynthesis protein UbiJ
VQIEGDVQLAAELAWLSDNLRWDFEEDLARLLGDIPAHALADAGRKLVAALRPWLTKVVPASSAVASTSVSAFRAGA